MTQKTRKLVSAPDVDKHALIRWLLTRGSDTREELDPAHGGMEEMDPGLAETEAARNGRPKTRKWVLLH
jgi:hypothetical protein